MKAFKNSLASVIKRSLSSQAASKPVPYTGPIDSSVKITTLPSGVMVASMENGCPVSRVAVIFNAGPRYETHENLGITHYLRSLVAQSTDRSSGLGTTRTLEHLGGNITCTTNREQVIYSLEMLRNHVEIGLEHLDYVANMPSFKPWEVKDTKKFLELDRDIFEQSLENRVIEMVHKAAFRDTLGNSLFINRDRIGSLKPSDLESFYRGHYVSSNAAVVGIGVDHELLVSHVRNFHFVKQDVPEKKKATYYGGEIRKDMVGDLAHVTCVTKGFSMDHPNLMALSLLQHIIGVDPSIKYSSNQVSKLHKAASSVATSPFAISCINCNYSDSGLFGLSLVSGAKDSGAILKSVVGVMNQAVKGKITNEELQMAKNRLKASMHFYTENSDDNLQWFGIEIISSKQFLNKGQLDAAIDGITLEQVAAVAKEVTQGKASMAAIGNLSSTPYADELFGQ